MQHTRQLIAIILVQLITATGIYAAQPTTQLLWPDGAPGAKGEEKKDKPTLIIYPADKEKANGCAVVVCPGGGYGGLAMGHEGHEIAAWLNSFGVSAFICDYRHRGKGYGHPAPLQDAQRAIRTVRANAKEWNVDGDRIGIIGFSAGGHLASTAGTHFDAGDSDSKDPIAQQSSRPDFMILCYAVIAFGEDFTHKGSQRNLLGADASEEMIRKFSNEKQVTKNTPPAFLWHTSEDTVVPPQNSVMFYMAMKRLKLPAQLHVFNKGRHGIGLAKRGDLTAAQWPQQCQVWMEKSGFLSKATESN